MTCHIGSLPTIINCTFVGNSSASGSGLVSSFGSAATVDNTIFAYHTGGTVIMGGVYGSSVILTCCDVYGNEGGDWVGYIADQYGINGNFCEDPLFCGPVDGSTPVIHTDTSPYSLHIDSPCLPGNHPYGYDCGSIGACGQGCGPSTVAADQIQAKANQAAVEATTWGKIRMGFGR